VSNSPFLFAVTQSVCRSGTGQIPDSSGVCVCPDGTSALSPGGTCVSVAALVLASIATFAIAVLVARRFLRKMTAAADDDEVQDAVRALRQRLHLVPREGILLSSDRVLPFCGKAKSVVFVQRSCLVTAKRLSNSLPSYISRCRGPCRLPGTTLSQHT
jgi:hypothetical protein